MMQRWGGVQRDGAFARRWNEGHPRSRPSVPKRIDLEVEPHLGLIIDHCVGLAVSSQRRGVVVRANRRLQHSCLILSQTARPLVEVCAIHIADGTVISTPDLDPEERATAHAHHRRSRLRIVENSGRRIIR
jgi:hypothetical protein